jgi:hypothetical protein
MAYRRPLKLVYYEACTNPDGAFRREILEVRQGRTLLEATPRIVAFLH